MCKTISVVYESVCNLCDVQHRLNPGSAHRERYIVQTSRILYERSIEHVNSLKKCEMDSFMLKHWSVHHKDSENRLSLALKF